MRTRLMVARAGAVVDVLRCQEARFLELGRGTVSAMHNAWMHCLRTRAVWGARSW